MGALTSSVLSIYSTQARPFRISARRSQAFCTQTSQTARAESFNSRHNVVVMTVALCHKASSNGRRTLRRWKVMLQKLKTTGFDIETIRLKTCKDFVRSFLSDEW